MKTINNTQVDQLYKKTGARKNCRVSVTLNTGTLSNKLAHSFNSKSFAANATTKRI